LITSSENGFINTKKLLGEYVKDGMVVLDVGCGSRLYSVEMAKIEKESSYIGAKRIK